MAYARRTVIPAFAGIQQIGNNMKCGIVGLPNVGKSTLFNCLTALKAPAENYPFCTIDPNIGLVSVPDPRLEELAHIFKPEKVIPTSIEFVDIAGLIPGAHKGEGLGNRFLSYIRKVDALIHVVRTFKNENIPHTQGNVDPLRDIQLIETELLLSDIESLEKKKEKLIKLSKNSKNKELKIEFTLIEKLLHLLLHEEKLAKEYKPEKEEENYFYNMHLLTSKPCLYLCNTEEEGLKKGNPLLKKVKNIYGDPSVLPICASLEAQIAELGSEMEKQEYLLALGLEKPSLNKLIKKSYYLLNLITFFTAGKKEVRAWTIPKGSVAPEAAGKIHSDFQKGFISAEVYHFEDLKKNRSEKTLKESGKYRQEGKAYVVQDGDIILFRFNI